MKDGTDALQRVLWGMEILERLDKSLTSGLSYIERATHHVETNLSKARSH
jgi:hypothetical protein